MRKSLWIIPVLLVFAAISAPNACADSYTVDFMVTGGNFSNPPAIGTIQFDPVTGIISPFTVTWDSSPFSFGAITLPSLLADVGADAITWSALASPGQFTFNDANVFLGSTSANTSNPMFSSLSDTANGTITLTAVPEPATASLMLLGIGLVLAMRKFIAA